ncbi:MAG: nucleotidyltransferase [Nanoarchaeota archaeon]|nr:nucleotidyltransferase [Nanoarchaeota archaeon]
MELEFSDNEIVIDKELSNLDKFVKKFVEVLDKNGIKYVIVSGYVAIFFGRSRHTEDVDLFIEKIDFEKFKQLWKDLSKEFECLNTDDVNDAYNNYLNENTALRFAKEGTFIPNIEVKFPKIKLDKQILNSQILVKCREMILYFPILESQIAFKLYLGSDKDLEDAEHLWTIFKENFAKLVNS